MRRPGVEPGTSAWKAPMLTVTPSTLMVNRAIKEYILIYRYKLSYKR